MNTELKQYVFAGYIGQSLTVTSVPDNISYPNYPFDINEGALFLAGVIGNSIIVRRIAEDIKDRFNQCALQLRPLSAITDSEAVEVAKLICGEQYTEIELNCEHTYHKKPVVFEITIKPQYNILTISFITSRENQHPQKNYHSVSISNWGSINWYRHYETVNTELSNCVRSLQVWSYLQQQGFALTVWCKGEFYGVERLVELGIYKLTE